MRTLRHVAQPRLKSSHRVSARARGHAGLQNALGRIGDRRHANRRAVQPRTLAVDARETFAQHETIDDANHRLALVQQRDRHRAVRIVAQIIDAAVERIDRPAIIACSTRDPTRLFRNAQEKARAWPKPSRISASAWLSASILTSRPCSLSICAPVVAMCSAVLGPRRRRWLRRSPAIRPDRPSQSPHLPVAVAPCLEKRLIRALVAMGGGPGHRLMDVAGSWTMGKQRSCMRAAAARRCPALSAGASISGSACAGAPARTPRATCPGTIADELSRRRTRPSSNSVAGERARIDQARIEAKADAERRLRALAPAPQDFAAPRSMRAWR